jgi:beta-lactamase class A
MPDPGSSRLPIPTAAEAPRHSRRRALAAGGLGVAGALAGSRASAGAQGATPAAGSLLDGPLPDDGLAQEVVAAFGALPGTKGLKLWAPPDAGRPEWSAEIDPGRQMFVASAFKAYALAACLRREEDALDPTAAAPLAAQLGARLAQPLVLDEAVFSPDSTVFNPPLLSGEVSLRTALEAMISHSDNTATDMVLRHVGADRVQAFVDDIGLRQTRIPTSTRQFIGYIFGLPDWQATTWADTQADDPSRTPRPILNDAITMASSPDDFASFYARALQGAFFRYPETLTAFRAVLRLADAIPPSMPLGASAFGKGGAIAFNGANALTFAGGVYVPDRWVSFALLLNWADADVAPGANVQAAYVAAVRTIFAVVQQRLGA